MKTLTALAALLLALTGCSTSPESTGSTPAPTTTPSTLAPVAYDGSDFSKRAYLNAEIPSMCGHPATTLVAGSAYDGDITVAEPFTEVRGPIMDGKAGSVLVVRCSAGKATDTTVLAFLDSHLAPVGTIDLADLPYTGRQYVDELSVHGHKVRVLLDGLSDGTSSALLTIKVIDGRPRVVGDLTMDGVQDVEKLLAAAKAGNRAEGLVYGYEKVYDSLAADFAQGYRITSMGFCTPHGRDAFPEALEDSWACGIALQGPHGEESNDALLMTPRDGGHWKAANRTLVAG